MKDKPYVILVADRARMGMPLRAVPKSYLRQVTTMTMARAKRFATKKEAKLHLRVMVDLGPRFLCMIANERTLQLQGVRRPAKPWKPLAAAKSREHQGVLFREMFE
jgi:hypothetical protein